MIYLVVSLSFAAIVFAISLDMLVKSALREAVNKITRIQFLLHMLNSTAILIVAWSYLRD